MKTKILLPIFLLISILIGAQSSYTYAPAPVNDTIYKASYAEAIESVFGLIPKSHYPSGYLFNKTAFPFKYHSANGQLNDSSFNMLEWYFIQNIVRNSYYRPDSFITYLKLDSLKNVMLEHDNILPFGLVHINGQAFKDSAFSNNWIGVTNKSFVENTLNYQKIYRTSKLFSACPLNLEIGNLNPHFIFKPEFIFTNTTKTITAIDVDLDDGLGYRNVILNYPFQATYANDGFKKIVTRIVYNSSDTLFSRSELFVDVQEGLQKIATNYTAPDETWSITANSDNGVLGAYPIYEFSEPFDDNTYEESDWPHRGVEIGVWYGCGNTAKKLRKPMIIFGGYNPKNGKSLSSNGNYYWWNDYAGPILALAGWRGSSYEAMNGVFTDFSKNAQGGNAYGDNGNRLLDQIRQEGYDILIVRFRDGISLLQNNAFLATLVIKDINRHILNETDGVTNPGAVLDPEDPNYPNSTKIKRAKHELVIGGYSAGALTSRMALLLMEYENWKRKCDSRNKVHRTKIWMAFEHEAQGSNTPIGFQMFLDFEKSMALLPANAADILNSIMCSSALGLLNHKGVATQNTFYHTSNMSPVPGNAWNVGHSPDFDKYFADLLAITPPHYPANLRSYPINCYRIAVGQGSADGIGQLLTNNISLIENQSPTTWCANSNLGIPFGPGTYVVPPGVGFLANVSVFRLANGRVLSSFNNNAFTCKAGLSIFTAGYSWHINFGHPKYFVNNYINDKDFGSYRPYDEVPGSTLPSHILLASKLPLSSRDLNIAAFAYCNSIDWNDNQHGFAPTVSLLDLHQPGVNNIPRFPDFSLIPGNVNGGLRLMQQNKYNNVFTSSPFKDFGYPHLTFPANHYDYTPYDAIWANTANNLNYNHNSMHIEDPTPQSAQFLVEEIAPQTLYLSNRTLKGDFYTCGNNNNQPLVNMVDKYYADFEARYCVLAGNQGIYKRLSNPNDPNSEIRYPRQRSSPGDFIIDDGAVVTMRSDNYNGTSSVTLGPGFSAKHGSIFRAYVFTTSPNLCNPFFYGLKTPATASSSPEGQNPRPIISTKTANRAVRKNMDKADKFIMLYPNPTNSEIYYDTKSSVDFEFTIFDAIGKVLQKGTFTKDRAKINLSGYAKGVYYITVTSGDMKQTDRIILQ